MKKKVQLVLGSGGARGIAHIAVIDRLEEEDFEIIEVAGCSMGAVIGGFYAAGLFDIYKEWMLNLSKRDLFDLMDFTLTKHGFVKGEKIFDVHHELFGPVNIDDFKIPFTAVATDMLNKREVLFKSGDLYRALRASGSIPGVYIPAEQDGRWLVDGGLLNPLPVNLVSRKKDALIVAVNLNGKGEPVAKNPHEEKEPEDSKWYERLIPDYFISHAGDHRKQKSKPFGESASLLTLMDRSYNITQDRLSELILEKYPPDVLVEIPRKIAGAFDFDKSGIIYEAGVKAWNKAAEKAGLL